MSEMDISFHVDTTRFARGYLKFNVTKWRVHTRYQFVDKALFIVLRVVEVDSYDGLSESMGNQGHAIGTSGLLLKLKCNII